MKKTTVLICLTMLLIGISAPVFAVNIGTYKTETEYGLLDGFKINWKRQDKSQKFIEPREQQTKEQKEKEYNDYKESEYERTKFMYEGKSIL